jgi:hypothetical protein
MNEFLLQRIIMWQYFKAVTRRESKILTQTQSENCNDPAIFATAAASVINA